MQAKQPRQRHVRFTLAMDFCNLKPTALSATSVLLAPHVHLVSTALDESMNLNAPPVPNAFNVLIAGPVHIVLPNTPTMN